MWDCFPFLILGWNDSYCSFYLAASLLSVP
ncbi:hypothetical protein GECvBGOT_gp009 [Salmonella phage GEC_vB_GOT]|nr:hypothetical protein GECvBGOT_gp009 [Salmonella phage GEC_vB_GOT]